MNVLLDTHVVVWWALDDRRLGKEARAAIAQSDRVFVSAASAWEAAIKAAAGKLKLRRSFAKEIEANEFEELRITVAHAEAAAALPRHHGDPFDRMLIAQAKIEGLTLVTADEELKAYEVSIVKA